MTLHSLQALTWGTVTGAVVSALLIASGESAWPEFGRWRRSEAHPVGTPPLPVQQRKQMPNRADPQRRPATAPPTSR
jgi:hypothetical protein